MVGAFDTIEELRQALLIFMRHYNDTWLVEKHRLQDAQRLGPNNASAKNGGNQTALMQLDHCSAVSHIRAPVQRDGAMSIIHRAIVVLWLLELVIFPVLALAEIGFAQQFRSNYFLRFSYIAVFLIAIAFHLVGKRQLVLPWVSIAFIAALVIGSAKGVAQGTVNSSFFSHVFYAAMPVVMLSYGYHFFEAYRQDAGLRRLMMITMLISLAVGAVAVGAFLYTYYSGYAVYNAVGLWNAMLAGPFLLNQPFAVLSLSVAVIVIMLAAKRGLILGLIVYGLVGLFMRNRRTVWLAMIPLSIALVYMNPIASFVINLSGRVIQHTFQSSDPAGERMGEAASKDNASRPNTFQSSDPASERMGEATSEDDVSRPILIVPNRLLSGAGDVADGGFDAASSGRLSEAQSAFAHLTSRVDHLMIGAGFGARYQPWEASPDYLVHYVHFTPLSYVWLGGIALPIAVYGFLLALGITLLLRARKKGMAAEYFFLIYWLWSIVGISALGAVLLNNSWLWLIIGAALSLAGPKTRLLWPSRP